MATYEGVQQRVEWNIGTNLGGSGTAQSFNESISQAYTKMTDIYSDFYSNVKKRLFPLTPHKFKVGEFVRVKTEDHLYVIRSNEISETRYNLTINLYVVQAICCPRYQRHAYEEDIQPAYMKIGNFLNRGGEIK